MRATLDMTSHTTSSSTTLMRRSECMQFVVEGTFAQENLAAFKIELESSIKTIGDMTVNSIAMAGFESVIVGG